MHGLLRCNINTGVHARAWIGRVTQRCHNSPKWETGASKCEWCHAPEARRGFWEILKKSVCWVESCLGRRRLTITCSRRPLAVVAHDGGGRWKSQNRKNVYLSPYIEEPLNSKVIKSFVPELRSRKCFSCLEIPMFYVYIYIYTNIMNVLRTGMNMSISHIAVSGYGTHRWHLCIPPRFTEYPGYDTQPFDGEAPV